MRPNLLTCGLDVSDSGNMGNKKTVCKGTPLAASFSEIKKKKKQAKRLLKIQIFKSSVKTKRAFLLCSWASRTCSCWHRATFKTFHLGIFDNLSTIRSRESILVPRKKDVKLPAVFSSIAQIWKDKIIHFEGS